jgi:hypothetical protein
MNAFRPTIRYKVDGVFLPFCISVTGFLLALQFRFQKADRFLVESHRFLQICVGYLADQFVPPVSPTLWRSM